MSYTRYANRTCNDCGAIHPQNEMSRVTRRVESGRSKPTFSIMDNNSKRRQNAFWGAGGRTYYRNKEVWLCSDCYGGSGEPFSFSDIPTSVKVIGVIFAAYAFFGGSDDAKKEPKPTPTPVVQQAAPTPAYNVEIDVTESIETTPGQSMPIAFHTADGGYAIIYSMNDVNGKLVCYKKETANGMHSSWADFVTRVNGQNANFYFDCEASK